MGGKKLLQYDLLHPTQYKVVLGNRNYLRDTNYNTNALTEVVKKYESSLTADLLAVYRQVIDHIKSGSGKFSSWMPQMERGKPSL